MGERQNGLTSLVGYRLQSGLWILDFGKTQFSVVSQFEFRLSGRELPFSRLSLSIAQGI